MPSSVREEIIDLLDTAERNKVEVEAIRLTLEEWGTLLNEMYHGDLALTRSFNTPGYVGKYMGYPLYVE